MKYIENNRANGFDTISKLDGVTKCAAAITANTACEVSDDKRYDGRTAARALYEEIAFCEALLDEIDEKDRESALADVRAWLDEEDRSMRERAMLGFLRAVL